MNWLLEKGKALEDLSADVNLEMRVGLILRGGPYMCMPTGAVCGWDTDNHPGWSCDWLEQLTADRSARCKTNFQDHLSNCRSIPVIQVCMCVWGGGWVGGIALHVVFLHHKSVHNTATSSLNLLKFWQFWKKQKQQQKNSKLIKSI
jgi:hypothetical protein